MKRNLILAIVGILILLLAVLAVGFFIVRGVADPDYLVQQIEKQFNCRAEVRESKLELFQSPAKLSLTDVSLAPRDEYSGSRTRMADRPEMKSVASIDYVLFELEPLPLLAGKFVIRNLAIESPTVEMVIHENGTTSFDEMLKPPPETEAKSEPKTAAPGGQPSQERLLKASDLQVNKIEGSVSIENASITATVEKSNTIVQVHRGIVEFTDIDLDPKDLSGHNSATVDMQAWIGIDSFERNQRYMDLSLEGHGAIQPFDPETAMLDPSLSLQVTVRKDSWIDVWPLLDDMEELIRNLEAYGVGLDAVRFRGDFSEDTSASFNATRRDLKMTTDFMIPIDENYLVIEEGSWVQTSKDDHDFRVTFVGSERLTRKAEAEIDKFLVKEVGETLAEQLKSVLIRTIKQGDFMVLEFSSKGKFGDPQVEAMTKVGSLQDLMFDPDAFKSMKEKASRILESLFGQ